MAVTKWLCATLLCLWGTPALAGLQEIAWDYDLAWQAGTRYWLRIDQQSQGRLTTREQALVPLPTAQCHPDSTWHEDSLCAVLCLEPGLYRLTLYAERDGTRSEPSPVLDADLLTVGPCHTVAVTPPPPPPSSPTPPIPVPPLPLPRLPPQEEDSPALTALINWQCVQWAIEGPCVCGFPPHPCVRVSYWEPAWLVETVKRPGSTTLSMLRPILEAALSPVTVFAGGGGANNASRQGLTNLHFSEAHVYPFPQLLGGPCTSCAPSVRGLALNYASELDPGWRFSKGNPLTALVKVGVWGPLFPRIGFTIHGSPSVASALTTVRALDVAHQPVAPPPNADVHVVPQPAPGITALGCCMQLAIPHPMPCMTAGTPPPLWDHGVISQKGMYLWIIWEKRSCCRDLEQATCGITMPGIGGHGQNSCAPIPSVP